METYSTLTNRIKSPSLVIFFTVLVSISCVFAADEKIYTQQDLDRHIERIKKSSIATLTKEILAKERALADREEELTRRSEQLKKAESDLSKKIKLLELEQKRIIGCIDDNQQKETMRINQLVDVISNMKPQKAAELLEVQDAPISVKILERIEAERASKIFNLMNKEVSARLQKQYLNMRH